MSNIDKLIVELCPDGVEFKPLWSITNWNKRFSEVDNSKQDTTIRIASFVVRDIGVLNIEEGDVKLLTTNLTNYWTSEEKLETEIEKREIIAIPGGGNAYVQYFKGKLISSDNRIAEVKNKETTNTKFLYYFLLNNIYFLENCYRGSGIKHPDMKIILELLVPIPPIEIQNEIVSILDKFTELEAELEAELQARKKQYEYYRYILLNDNHKIIKRQNLGSICDNMDSQRKPVTQELRISGVYPYYGASGIVDFVEDYIFDGDYLLVSEDGANLLARSTPIAFSISGKNWVNNHAHVLKFQNSNMRLFVEHYLNSIDISAYVAGGAQPKLNQANLNRIEIPIFSDVQVEKIVNTLNTYFDLCFNLSKGLPAEIEARRKQYEYYRNKLLTFKELKSA
jgi:type I restriction enzyme S subunit